MEKENKILQTPYERFNKVFKKKEQICIYGADWTTHGYISNIEFDGVTLTQLRNQKGIKYPWNCFEVIAHAGYKITKSKVNEVEDIFEFKLSTHPSTKSLPTVENSPKEMRSKRIEKCERIKTELYFPTKLKFKKGEIQKDVEIIYDKYEKDSFDVNFHFKIDNLVGNMMPRHIWKDYSDIQIYPVIDKLIRPILIKFPQKYGGEYGIWFEKKGYEHDGDTIYGSGCWPSENFHVWNQKSLELFRKLKWKKKEIKPSTLGCGDPVIFDGIPTGYKTWKGKDGYVMANHHADIYV